MLPLYFILVGIVLVGLLRAYKSRGQSPLPPGPKGRWPLAGMTFDMPGGKPWDYYADWARSAYYSSRPPSQVGDIISLGMRSVLMPYGNHWRRVRRIFANVVTAKKCDTYVPIQQAEALVTIKNIADNPDTFFQEMHRYSTSVARSVAFGKRVASSSDPFALQVTQLMKQFSAAMTPGKYIIDAIPALRRLPRFMQPWLAELEAMRNYENEFSLMNYRNALQDAEKHPDRPSVARDVHKEAQAPQSGEVSDLQAATTCMEILGAGSDTTANSLLWTIIACVTNPDVQRKAHEELDRVVGHDRFPTWEDEVNLPYIRAMVKEQHRWRTIAPTSFAHWSDREDTLNGYRIPKGAVVRIVTWAIHMDPARYADPQSFSPERFLSHPMSASAYANSPDVDARDHFGYGGGKRVCVGLHLAERSLFIMTSRLLHAFNIKHALDANKQPIPVDPDASRPGLIMAPEEFRAAFEVRSERLAELLRNEWEQTLQNVGESWGKL